MAVPRPTATEQPEPAVSIASRMEPVLSSPPCKFAESGVTEDHLARACPGHSRLLKLVRAQARRGWPGQSPATGVELDRADLDNFGDVMAEHVLDPRLQGRGRARAARARALHVQVDDAVLKII